MIHSPATTPRTPRRVLTKSTNTTPARYPNAIAQQQPLPSLSLKPYPITSYVTLIENEFSQQRESDILAMEYAVQQMSEKVSEKKKVLAQAQAEVEEEKRRIEEETKTLGDKAREMVSILKLEREEMEQAREMEAEVLKAGRALHIQMSTIESDLKEITIKLMARKELKSKQKESFHRQSNKNAPEIAFFEDKLGLKIKGQRRDVVQFKFSNIDPANYTRHFSFDLDASKPSYSISAINPSSFLPPTIILPYLNSLNSTRDLYSFVQSMRNLFRDEVKLEKMGLNGILDGEGEKERKKIREERERR